MNVRCVACALVIAVATLSPARAQTNRERAVAIDRVPVPPTDHFEVEEIGPTLAAPWSLAFLPDGSFLITEKHGGVRIVHADGSATAPLPGGPPNVLQKADSGLHDILLDPDFAANRMVYIAFAEGTEQSNRTAIWKARLEGDQLSDGQVIFRVSEAKNGSGHPGGRMLFLPDKSLLLTVGDGFDYRDKAQDPASQLGKVLRLDRDGRAPPDNPFVGRAGHAPEIWTLGHRNIQGLTRDPVTGTIWAHEHGPRGGDEINELVAGRNYSWPSASFGIDYDGKLITDRHHVEGMADPRFVWAPSIAPSGLAVYHGSVHREWEGRLLVGALATRMLAQVRINPSNGLLAEEGRWLVGLKARIRDVRVAPDGEIYLLTDDERGRLLRLVRPAPTAAVAADNPLTPIGFLAGEWTGESIYTPALRQETAEVRQATRTRCAFILGNAYLRCNTRFLSADGSSWHLEHQFRRGRGDPGIQARLLEEGYAGDWLYHMTWDATRQAFVADYPTEIEGRKVVERYILTPGADRNSLVQTEEVRLEPPGSPWYRTRVWTWTRQK